MERRDEPLVTLPGSGPCNGYHRVQRIVHVYGDDPTPPWPEEDTLCERCACGAELEFLTVTHRHIQDQLTVHSRRESPRRAMNGTASPSG